MEHEDLTERSGCCDCLWSMKTLQKEMVLVLFVEHEDLIERSGCCYSLCDMKTLQMETVLVTICVA